uniref:ABC transporter A family member 8 n=1 Tax=Aegilops tauschii TaxID=37682 RepID=R7W8J3_AEGTA
MEPLSGAAAAAAAAGGGGASRPPSFASQTNALLRKNLIFQVQSMPILQFFRVLQRVINNLLDKPKYKCGCMCVDVNGTGPCQNVCGIQYSTLDQAGSCPIPNPPEWPALLQVPRPEYRAIQDSSESCRKSQSCPAAIPFTGANETLSTTVMQNMFTDLPLLNISDNASISGLLLGTDMPGTSTGFIEPAFISDLPIYVLQSECKSRDSVTLRTTIDAINVQKEIKCVQGLPLWRNSSRTINEETFKGYRKGKIGKGISEVAMAYDFQDSNEKRFNVLALYNSTYQNISYVPMPFGLLRVSRSLNAVSNAYLQFLQGQGSGIKMLLEFTKEMPKQATRLTIDFSSLIGPLFFEWVVALLFPVMLTYLVYEKQHKLRTMMKMHGLGNGPYWIIYYAYFLILSTVYLVLFVIFGALIGLNFFKTNDYGIQFVFFFSFINLQIVLSFLAATFFSKVNTAQAIAYLYIFGSGLMAGSLIRNFLEGGKFPRHWITVLEIIPAFSLYRGLYELSQYAIRASETGNPGIQWSDLNDHTNGMRDVMIIIIVEWLVLLPVAYYFDYAASVGNSSGLLSIIKRLLRKNPTWRRIAVNEVADNDVHVEMEKLDIIKERETVDQVLQQRNSGYAVVCDDLKKVYHGKDGNPDKYAVRGLSLALPMLWEMLTGREHLQFYGRLKSLSGSALDLAVEESLRSVNLLLGGAADKQVRKYSGGMKRRLSIAISLIGDAKVVYMDEPSTGLDPASRKSLWTAVKQAKQDRAIILTSNLQPMSIPSLALGHSCFPSMVAIKPLVLFGIFAAHSMEEAEVLCDRLCIMVDGRLQCIGRPKELIARYGGYYVLTMTTSSEFEREVEDLALKLLPNARKVYHLSGTQKYELSKQQVRIADVFMAVENLKRRVEVQAWGLADTTMEDVFVKVATGAQSSDELS